MAKLKKELNVAGQRVSLTTDCWTSCQQIPYLCLTAHWIDCNWCLKKRILSFVQIPNHKGDSIAKLIESCLQTWGIEKVYTITLDNASANDVAVGILKRRVNGWNGAILDGDYMHVRCAAHIINLIVDSGLKEMHESICAIRNAIRYIRLSTARLEKFAMCVSKEKIEFKGKLILDCSIRWNSTYKMLHVALKCQKAFERYEEEDDKYIVHFQEDEGGKKKVGPPSTLDWNNARIFVNFLQSFYDVTLKFSATNSVSVNCFYNEICELHNQLNQLNESDDILLSKMVSNMKLKFDKYWGNPENINLLMFLAIVLDPRYKMEYVKFSLKFFYDAQTVTRVTLLIEQTLNRLYVVYGGGLKPKDNASDESAKFNAAGSSHQRRTFLSNFIKHQEEHSVLESCNEVEKYLGDENVSPLTPSFDILLWWKVNSTKYNILAMIARDVLAVPVSSVASEQAFSTGGRILDPYRSSLNPKTVNYLICTQSWLKGANEGVSLEVAEEEEDAELGLPHNLILCCFTIFLI
ncbi:hypothetical protein UlMin_026422 [Ulmus minor]